MVARGGNAATNSRSDAEGFSGDDADPTLSTVFVKANLSGCGLTIGAQVVAGGSKRQPIPCLDPAARKLR
jgi:hypothetical protein